MYTLPSRDIVVQTCRGVGQVLLYYVQNVWEWGGWYGISLIYPYVYLYCGPDIQGGREVTVPRPVRYHNLIWITYVHLVTCPVDPYVHLDAGHTNECASMSSVTYKCSFKTSRMERAKCAGAPSCCSHTSSRSPLSLS